MTTPPLTVRETASALNCTTTHAYNLLKAGRIRRLKDAAPSGHNRVRVSAVSVAKYRTEMEGTRLSPLGRVPS